MLSPAWGGSGAPRSSAISTFSIGEVPCVAWSLAGPGAATLAMAGLDALDSGSSSSSSRLLNPHLSSVSVPHLSLVPLRCLYSMVTFLYQDLDHCPSFQSQELFSISPKSSNSPGNSSRMSSGTGAGPETTAPCSSWWVITFWVGMAPEFEG